MGSRGMRWSAAGVGLGDGDWWVVPAKQDTAPGDVVCVNGLRVLVVYVEPDPPMIEPPSPDEELARFRCKIASILSEANDGDD